MIAKVVVGLPIEGPFDYLVSRGTAKEIRSGIRAWVNFRNKRLVGFIIGLASSSKFRKLKIINSCIDQYPILDERMLKFLKIFSDYYCVSLGEAIEASIPKLLKTGKPLSLEIKENKKNEKKYNNKFSIILVHNNTDDNKKWSIILDEIDKTLASSKSVVFLVPEISYFDFVLKKIKARILEDIAIWDSKLAPKQQLNTWKAIKEGAIKIVVGTRSAVFLPLNNLGLIIVYEEDNASFKQEQTPFYHARETAIMRAKLSCAKIILSSAAPSLEALTLTKKKWYRLLNLSKNTKQPLVQIVDMSQYRGRRGMIVSPVLESNIQQTLKNYGKVILFLNRKGFSNFMRCRLCGYSLKCLRCNVSLTYYFNKKKLICRFCNYQTPAITMCPNCKNSYLRYSGMGTEKLESEIHRLFAQKKILRFDYDNKVINKEFDILITTSIILKEYFSITAQLLGLIHLDDSLNRLDFRAAEKTFALIMRLSRLAREKLIIQTFNPKHYVLEAAKRDDFNFFYKRELKLRKSLGFPPFKHLVYILLRGKDKESLTQQAQTIYNYFMDLKLKEIEIFEPVPDTPSRLRGKFRCCILLKAKSVLAINSLIKKCLKECKRKSGIIISINVDP